MLSLCAQVVLAVQSNAMLTFDYVILIALARCVCVFVFRGSVHQLLSLFLNVTRKFSIHVACNSSQSWASAEYWTHFTAHFRVFRLLAAITPQ